jgi:hypothetical protein
LACFCDPRVAPASCAHLTGRFGDSDRLASLTHFEARKPANRNIFAQLTDLSGDELTNADGLVADEGLLEQANFFVELAHLAFNNLLDHLWRFPGGGSLRTIDVLFALESLGRNVFLAHEFRVAGGDMHRNVVYQFLEVIGARYKVAFAIDFDKNTDLASGVDIARDSPLFGHAAGFLAGNGDSLLAQKDNSLLQITFGFGECVFAVHHWRSGLFPELFHLSGRNVHGRCTHV